MTDEDLERDEILLSRVVDGEASPADWAELELFARRDADLWQRLAAALKAEAQLRSALEARLTVADRVELDLPAMPERRARRAGASSIVGWAAAALFAALWIGSLVGVERDPATEGLPSGVAENTYAPPADADAALDQYLDLARREGRWVGELPQLVVDTRTSPDEPAMEVLYLRRFLERKTVDDFYQVDRNEQGAHVVTPVSFQNLPRTGSL
ncbi:MAG: hypothetical protein KDC38_17240 [Planctomycetes bacterium]|nr:hypothetical protein [Planctomycetota bacterium]